MTLVRAVEYVPGTHLLFHHRFAGLGVIHRRHARVSCGQSAILTVNGPCSASADANRIAVAAQQPAVPEVTATAGTVPQVPLGRAVTTVGRRRRAGTCPRRPPGSLLACGSANRSPPHYA